MLHYFWENCKPFKCNLTDYFSNIASKNDGSIKINTQNNNSTVYLDKSKFNNLIQSEWKAQYPDLVVELEYALPKGIEIIEPYTLEQQEAYNKLKKLKMNYGVNHIYTEGSVVEPNLKLEYKVSNRFTIEAIKKEIEGLKN